MLTASGVVDAGTEATTDVDLLTGAEVVEREDVDAGNEAKVELIRAVVLLSSFARVDEPAFLLNGTADDVVVVDPMSICRARVAFMMALP